MGSVADPKMLKTFNQVSCPVQWFIHLWAHGTPPMLQTGAWSTLPFVMSH